MAQASNKIVDIRYEQTGGQQRSMSANEQYARKI